MKKDFDFNWKNSYEQIYIKDPVDGGRVLRNTSRDEIFAWCEEHCTGKYWIGMGFGIFELECDEVLFKMRWG